MINQYCQEESYSSGIETNVHSATSLPPQRRCYQTLDFTRQFQKEPHFVDAFAKMTRENLQKQQLASLVEEVTQVLLASMNKLVHQAFYREINTLVSQVLYIREELSNFTRDELRERQLLKTELKQEIARTQKSIESLRRDSRSLSIPSFSRHYTSRLFEKDNSKDMSICSNCQFTDSQTRKNVEDCLEQLEDFKKDTLKQQLRIINKLQQTKQKHFSAYNSLRTQIEQLSQNFALQTILQNNLKELFESVQKLKEHLLDCQKQVTHIKQALIRYNEQGILYFASQM